MGVGNVLRLLYIISWKKSLTFSLANKSWSSGTRKDLRGQLIHLCTSGKFCVEKPSPKHNCLAFSLTVLQGRYHSDLL